MVDLDIRRSAVPEVLRPWSASIRRVAAWPLAMQVAAVYLLSRVVSTAIFVEVGRHTEYGSQVVGGTDLMTQLLTWDSDWYQRIAFDGYPSTIPVEGGLVQHNAWAFLPVYSLVAKWLAFGRPELWPYAAVLVSTVSGLFATVLLAALIRRRGSSLQAMTAAVIFCLGPTAYILQTAYAESLGLLMLFGFLLLVDGRRYGWAALVALPMAFTRPGMQAVALFVGLHLIARFVNERRAGRGLARRELFQVLGLGAWTASLGFAWPGIAGLVTGRRDAYIVTEISWRRWYTGSTDLDAFKGWAQAFSIWFGPSGLLLLAVVLIAAAALLLSRRVRALGPTVGLFAAAWFAYLLMVLFPQSSTFRLLMPAAPLGAAFAPSSRRGVVLLAVCCVLLQAFWLYHGYGAPTGPWTAP